MTELTPAAEALLLGATVAGASPLLAARPISRRLTERVKLGPGAVLIGHELETRGGRSHTKHSLSGDPRDHRHKTKPRRYVERLLAPVFCPAHIWRLIDRLQHVQVLGPTATGKSTALANLISQDLREGMTVFILETSGNLASKVEGYVAALGRPTMIVDPSRKGASWRVNLLVGDPTRVAERVVSAFQAILGESHDFFKHHNHTVLTHMVFAAKAWERKQGRPATLETVLKCATDDTFLRDAIGAPGASEKNGGAGGGRKGGKPSGTRTPVVNPHLEATAREYFEKRYFNMTDDERDLFTSGMKTALGMLMLRQEVKDVLCPQGREGEREVMLEEALDSGGLVVVRLSPGDCGSDNAINLASWFLRVFMAMIAERPDGARPIMAYFDELHQYFGTEHDGDSKKFASFTATARHKNCAVHVAYHSNSQIPRELEAEFDINLRNKILLGGQVGDGAEKVQRILSSDARTIKRVSRETGEKGLKVSTSVEETPRWSLDEISSVPRSQALVVRVIDANIQYPVLVQIRKPPNPAPPAEEPVPTGAPPFFQAGRERAAALGLALRRRDDTRELRKTLRGREKEIEKRERAQRKAQKQASRRAAHLLGGKGTPAARSGKSGAPPRKPAGGRGAGRGRR